MELSNKDKLRIQELIDVCKKSQGEHLPLHHGSGSWATTYSNQFKYAAAEMYVIFEKSGYKMPIWTLSHYFKEAEILSCRGTTFTADKVEYLYNNHLIDLTDKYK